MSEAITELKKMSMDEKERAVYEARRMALVDAMTRESYSYGKGKKEGEEIGIKKGKLEGIELALELKFGGNGLSLMDEVRKISDLEKLTQFQQRIKTAQSVDELRQELG